MSIKWLFTFLMFVGAVAQSFQLSYIIGGLGLFVGNLCWAIYLTYYKDWPAASVFYLMSLTWGIGLSKYLFF
jgi:drug/metabolite transporter (DMT)-like permease